MATAFVDEEVYELTSEEEREIDEAEKTPLVTYEEFRREIDECLKQLATEYQS